MAEKKTTSYPKEKINILFLENISDAAVKHFVDSGYASVRKLTGALSEEQLIREIQDVHLLGIRSKTQITPKVLDAARKLQAIGCFCIGVNQVDLKAATTNGVVVFNAPYSNTRSVAELVIGLAILLIRRIPDKTKAAHEGIWLKESKGSYELRGKTLGIIGYGNIGTQVSILAEALGMKVIYYDTVTKMPLGNAQGQKDAQRGRQRGRYYYSPRPGHESDQEHDQQNGAEELKKGSILLNYARGEVVDLEALAKALEDGAISGAAIDVYPWEPEKNGDRFTTPLQGLSNVILTPTSAVRRKKPRPISARTSAINYSSTSKRA